MVSLHRMAALTGLGLICLSLVACNGGSSSTTASTPTYTVGGTITGLAAGQSVTLLDNGGDGYVATGNGAFTFATPLAAAATYSVTVGTQPSNGTAQTQKCSVTSGSGTVGSANISNVSVSCLNLGFTSLYSFGGGSSDGANPYAGLVMDASGNLYGTTYSGGTNNLGAVFKIDPSGSETVLHSFGGVGDGANPYAGLVMDANGNLYGTTYYGGASGFGAVFKIDTSGKETVLKSFSSGTDGANPRGGLIMDASGNLYGTTYGGGWGKGTVFEIDPSGSETQLYWFSSGGSDGQNPYAGLVMDANGNLYGTTYSGGTNNLGTVFKVDPSGSETVLHSFGGAGDGQNPYAGLVMDANGNLYGTTYYGGATGFGAAFKIDPSTSPVTETVLHSFSVGSDGVNPQGRLVMDASGNLYGTTQNGGATDYGTVFKIDPSGSETVLYSFSSGSGDGQNPYAGLVMDANGNLYGTTYSGRTNGNGTVFRYVLP